MPGLGDMPGDQFVTATIPAQTTAGSAQKNPVFIAPFACVITAVKWIPAAAVTGANTNNFALGLINRGAAGAGTTAITTVKTYASGTDSVSGVPETFTLSSTASDTYLAAGDQVDFARTVNASGLASPNGVVQITFRAR